MEILRLDNIAFSAGGFAMHHIDFAVNEGGYFILLGPSGAGKTLILELIAGFYKSTQGRVLLKKKDISHMPVQMREVGLLFQDFALFPHLTVFENIAFSVRKTENNRQKLSSMVQLMAADLEIEHLLHRAPATLSGGEQQRVALARTLMKKPAVLLLDEPLASLDVQLRGGIRSLLRRLNQKGQTILHVTHDYEEAAILGHRIAVVENHTIVQTGSHDEVFHHPRSAFVANFAGIRNFFSGSLFLEPAGVSRFSVNGIVFKILTDQKSGNGFAIIRSEDIFLSSESVDSTAANSLEGIIKSIEPARLGNEITVYAGIPLIAHVTTESTARLGLIPGKSVWVSFKASAVRFIAE